ncbi:hypothetical protein ACFYUH_35360 [Streptomyces fimicarius]|uniref:hypothetical protein n=1 Tax=Streptomyces griseus TaxID=1911 RepID=UPI0036A4F546
MCTRIRGLPSHPVRGRHRRWRRKAARLLRPLLIEAGIASAPLVQRVAQTGELRAIGAKPGLLGGVIDGRTVVRYDAVPLSDGALDLSSAGHPPPLQIPATGPPRHLVEPVAPDLH